MKKERKVKDFFWAYGDILRSPYKITNNVDLRVLGFMAIKLLCDNKKLNFSFNYKNNFGIDKSFFKNEKTSQEKFLKIIKNIKKFVNVSENFKIDDLDILLDEQGFNILRSIKELSNQDFERVLDIYQNLADFKDFPKEEYKDLYELTITRLQDKNYKGDLLGQYFTQSSIIHLMCEIAIPSMKNKNKIAIYDPTCGSGSMLLESYFYFKNHSKTKNKHIEVYGQEFDKRVYLLCNIFLEISGVEHYNIAYGDTLINPAFIDGINGEDSFDFIIANPPFGVDWKHIYNDIIELMKQNKNFLVVKDKKGKIVTPKKSDGQFLFLLHILRLLFNEKNRKDGFAAVITSSTLISNGGENSSECKIRRKIFNTGLLKAIIEQPKAMFTNTDLATHIWIFDTTKKQNYLKVLKVDNKKEQMFINHPNPRKKMKYAYSKENIKKIARYIKLKKEIELITKNIDISNICSINIASEIEKEVENNCYIDIISVINNYKKHANDFCNILKKGIW